MNDFILYFKMGLFHVLDIRAYDHILFLIVLACVYIFRQWKKVIWLVTLFTIGHTLTLALAAYKVISIDIAIVEFLIPVTIFITAVVNIITVKRTVQKSANINLIFALVFGLIHGFGFSNYFKMLMAEEEDKITPLLGFATGIELSQIIIILVVLIIAHVILDLLKVKRSIFIAVASILIIAITIPLLIATFPI